MADRYVVGTEARRDLDAILVYVADASSVVQFESSDAPNGNGCEKEDPYGLSAARIWGAEESLKE